MKMIIPGPSRSSIGRSDAAVGVAIDSESESSDDQLLTGQAGMRKRHREVTEDLRNRDAHFPQFYH